MPYGQPERLVVLWSKNEKKNLTQQPTAFANFKDWREQSQNFEQLAAIRGASFGLTDRGEPERVPLPGAIF